MKECDMHSIDGFTKVQVKSFMKMKLRTDAKWAQNALIKIFDAQTPAEKRQHIAISENGTGFNAFDAPLLCSMACKVKCGKKLNTREIKVLKESMPKYAAQMVNMSDKPVLKDHLKKYYLV